jgi:hypothetical protein
MDEDYSKDPTKKVKKEESQKKTLRNITDP